MYVVKVTTSIQTAHVTLEEEVEIASLPSQASLRILVLTAQCT